MVETLQAPQSCILFATADWDEPYWTNKQHCAKSLAELGTRVLYVESVGLRKPRPGSGRDWRRLFDRLRKGLSSLVFGAPERSPGVFIFSPLVVPAGYRHPLLRRLNDSLLRLAIRRSMKRHELRKPMVWTYHPFMLDAIVGLSESSLLYHCVDDLASVPGVDAKAFRVAEIELLERADAVFVTAEALIRKCREHNPNTHYLPNVVDVEHFGKALQDAPLPADLAKIPEPRLVYHGVLSDFKIDFKLLLDLAYTRPEWSLVLIGEEREGQKNQLVAEMAKLKNVHFLGYKPYALLPNYLRQMQVGLLPTLLNEYTRGMFPMKFYEYLAAGLPVVSTPLEFVNTQKDKIRIGTSVKDFSAAIEYQLQQGRYGIDKVRDMIGSNTWSQRTQAMLKVLLDAKKNG